MLKAIYLKQGKENGFVTNITYAEEKDYISRAGMRSSGSQAQLLGLFMTGASSLAKFREEETLRAIPSRV